VKETGNQLTRLWHYFKVRIRGYLLSRLRCKTGTLEWRSEYLLGHEGITDVFRFMGETELGTGNPRGTGKARYG
jgi:hypothetical protein